MRRTAAPSVRMFVSYSHLDREWFAKLRPLLEFRSPTTHIAHIWHDHELVTGDRWDGEIRAELAKMDVFVCLVSSHTVASRYINEVEIETALDREKQGKTIIVPLFLCDMDSRDIEGLRLQPFNPLPEWGRSWRSFERDGGHTMDAHKPIREGLLDVIEKVQASRAR